MMPDDSISDEEFNDILAQMKTSSSDRPVSSKTRKREQTDRSSSNERDVFEDDSYNQDSWERQMEERISDLDSRRSQDTRNSNNQDMRRDRGDRGYGDGSRGRQGKDKLERAINLVVEDLKDKGYTDDFISNNREMIRNKVKDYMRQGQSLF